MVNKLVGYGIFFLYFKKISKALIHKNII